MDQLFFKKCGTGTAGAVLAQFRVERVRTRASGMESSWAIFPIMLVATTNGFQYLVRAALEYLVSEMLQDAFSEFREQGIAGV